MTNDQLCIDYGWKLPINSKIRNHYNCTSINTTWNQIVQAPLPYHQGRIWIKFWDRICESHRVLTNLTISAKFGMKCPMCTLSLSNKKSICNIIISDWRWFEVTNAYLIENQYWWKWCGRKETHEYVVCAKCKIKDLTMSRFKMKSAIYSWMTMECACHVIFTVVTLDVHFEWYGFCRRHWFFV